MTYPYIRTVNLENQSGDTKLIPDLRQLYYTKVQIDQMLAGLDPGQSAVYTFNPPLSASTDNVVSIDLADYALASSVPASMSQLINDTGYITSSALVPYATQTWTTARISTHNQASDAHSLKFSQYTPTQQLTAYVQGILQDKSYISTQDIGGYLYAQNITYSSQHNVAQQLSSLQQRIQDLQQGGGSGGVQYTFKAPLSKSATNEVSIDLTSYAKLADLPKVPTVVSAFTNDAGYITLSALNGYATESFVTSQGYITSADIPDIPVIPTDISAFNNDVGYITLAQVPTYNLTKAAVDEVIGASAAGSATMFYNQQGAFANIDLTGYATETFVTSRGYATESFVTSQGYITVDALSGYATTTDVSTAVSNHNTATDAHTALFNGKENVGVAQGLVDDHAVVTASDSVLGHIKVDNDTITVDDNGVAISHAVGHNIFDIFYAMSSQPPPGAMDLSLGTLIENCSVLYPDFWQACVDRRTAGSIRTLTEDEWQAEVAANGSCGAFVVDETAMSVRLPKITHMIQPGDIGEFTEAGLPNIVGTAITTYAVFRNKNTGALIGVLAGQETASTPSYNTTAAQGLLTLDASKSNSIYGNSTTVQPPAVGAKLYIQVYTAAVPVSMVQAAQLIGIVDDHVQQSATEQASGHIKVDNDTITVDENGVATSHAIGHNIFDIFYAMSSKTPAGAMDLSLGTLIASCNTVFPDFWSECLQRRGNVHMFPQFSGSFYYYWSGNNVIGGEGINGWNGNAVCYYNGKIYVLAKGECDGHATPPPQSQEWRQFIVPTEQWDAQQQYSIGDTVLYNGQIWCARPKFITEGVWYGVGIAPGTTDADGRHHWALYDLPTQIIEPYIRLLTEDEWQAEVTANGSCGAFVVDEDAMSVRLPKITHMIQPGDVGMFTEAGLPNITGSFSSPKQLTANYNFSTAAGAFYSKGQGGAFNSILVPQTITADYQAVAGFSASNSNSIYGNSSTVQPPAVGAKLYIQVYTSAVPASVAQAAEFINMLETKADKTELETKADKTDLSAYLPLRGGTLTGNYIYTQGTDKLLYIHGSSSPSTGGYLTLVGKDYGSYKGAVILTARVSESQYTQLIAMPDGTLTWGGASVLNPTGTVIAFAGNSAPPGYLICNGAAVSRTTYAKLFTVIGTYYGTGDGSTTFNLPNLTDKFIMGSGTAGIAKSAGLPNITGNFGSFPITGNRSYNSQLLFSAHESTAWGLSAYSGAGVGGSVSLDASRGSSIYGNSTTVQPPALTMRYYIKY